MSTEWHKYKQGIKMLAEEFKTEAGARLFGGVLWEDHLRDKNTTQYRLFDSEVEWQKVHPIELKSPAEIRLLRPSDTREGRRQSEIEALDSAMEQQRIRDIKAELAKL